MFSSITNSMFISIMSGCELPKDTYLATFGYYLLLIPGKYLIWSSNTIITVYKTTLEKPNFVQIFLNCIFSCSFFSSVKYSLEVQDCNKHFICQMRPVLLSHHSGFLLFVNNCQTFFLLIPSLQILPLFPVITSLEIKRCCWYFQLSLTMHMCSTCLFKAYDWCNLNNSIHILFIFLNNLLRNRILEV